MLSALDIYKLLPRTNCKKCGSSTCLAFAMQLTTGKANASACVDMTAESKNALDAWTKPPIAEVKLGDSRIGGETVLYRHEKKFINPCLFCVTVDTDADGWAEMIDKAIAFSFKRIGQEMRVDMLRIKGSDGRFIEAVKRANGMPLLLDAAPALLEQAMEAAPNAMIGTATDGNMEQMAGLAKRYACPLLLYGGSIEETRRIASGLDNIVLLTSGLTKEMFCFLTTARRKAIKERDNALGHPILAETCEFSAAAMAVAKYASIVSIPGEMIDSLEPLMALRQAIYSDPQKPLQIRPGLYEINDPGRDAKVVITTNFSLTYYTVAGDIEASKIPVYLVVVDTTGQSVLTAFASEKLTAERISKSIRESGVMEKVDHNEVIIPGLVPALKGEIEEKSGLDVTVGPRNSSKLKAFLAGGEVR